MGTEKKRKGGQINEATLIPQLLSLFILAPPQKSSYTFNGGIKVFFLLLVAIFFACRGLSPSAYYLSSPPLFLGS